MDASRSFNGWPKGLTLGSLILWYGQISIFPCFQTLQRCGCRLYDIRTGQAVRNLETKCPTTSVEISRDGRFITTADGKDVKIWDARKFSLVKAHTLQHAAESATLYPSIKRFVAAGNDMWVRLFDSETGEELGEWSRQLLISAPALRLWGF